MTSKLEKKSLESELEALIAKRDMYFAKIQRIHDYTKNFDNSAVVDSFKAEYHTLEIVVKTFAELIDQINTLSRKIDDKYVFNYNAVDNAEQLYGHIREAYLHLMKKDDVYQNISVPKSVPKLPIINLMDFHGEKKQFPLFIETFNSLVGNNPNLDDITKVHYLLSALKGPAQALCASVLPTASNYSLLIRTLKERYEDKRLLANMYLAQMLEFKPAHSEAVTCLNAFLEKFDTAYNALRNLNVSDLLDYIIVYLGLSKLDSQTHKYFEMNRNNSSFPTYTELIDFIKHQITSLNHSSKISNINKSVSRTKTQTYVTSCQSNNMCSLCNQGHQIFQCNKFVQMSPTDRYKTAKEKNLCLNCLSSLHKMAACKSVSSCKRCHKSHHSLLHFEKKLEPISDRKNLEPETGKIVTAGDVPINSFCCNSFFQSNTASTTTLLSTAIVNVYSSTGVLVQARFLIDTASQSNFITTNLCKKLGLITLKRNIAVLGIGGCTQKIRGCTEVVMVSRFNPDVRFNISTLVIDKISEMLPAVDIKVDVLGYLTGVKLADECFHKPGTVDGILGADLFPRILGSGRLEGGNGLPIAVETTLGYILMGSAPSKETPPELSQTFCSTMGDSHRSLENILQKFWETEEINGSVCLSPEDANCEEFYRLTTSRDQHGRYCVALPFKGQNPNIGDSLDVALKRFLSLEKRFQSDTAFKNKYFEAFQNYVDQGHMSLVGALDNSKISFGYFVPHFAVMKNSVSTPLRIVFDSSARTSNARSLNDELHSGPKLQSDIFQILLKFRLYRIAMIADVRQMYRNISLRKEDRKYQRVLWRFSPDQPVSVYEMNCVSFGLKPSPYLALRTMQQLASDEASRFPLASECVHTALYVDDVVVSTSQVEEAKDLFSQLVRLFNTGGFELVKWSSNSKELLSHIPEQLRFAQDVAFNNMESQINHVNVLGMQWDPNSDVFYFRVNVSSKMGCTKRRILSTIARIWDPLGFLSAVTLNAKLLMRELWLCNVGWDDVPPDNIVNRWYKFHSQLSQLERLIVPRHIGAVTDSHVSLIGFSDASQKGFGAMVYIRAMSDGQTKVALLCAKSKVAPLKSLSIARLELCAATLLARLLEFVVESFSHHVRIDDIRACTDSTVVLHWISGSPHRWQTFVANRVAKIQASMSEKLWFHIDGKDNPADCLSRGLMPSELVEHQTWISGPSWLVDLPAYWPIRKIDLKDFSQEEARMIVMPTLVKEGDRIDDLIEKSSSWSKLLRIMVYILRFCKQLSPKTTIDATDLDKAEKVVIKVVQSRHFANDMSRLIKEGKCSQNLRKLTPFLDTDGCLRVGGRLGKASLEFDQQHPYLLPQKNNLVDILIFHVHENNFHTGPSLLTSILRQKYWILSCRSLARKCVRQCNYCFKFKPRAFSPIMADLPKVRISEAKPFVHTGVDYGGPFHITISRKRGIKSQKAYICLFVCLVTKALHLELASDLSTAVFLNCFKRFLARRGSCRIVYSDCGTNFVGAKAELDEIHRFLKSDYESELAGELASLGIEWQFNPPSAPHFGGIWEANIKCVKQHLYKAIGTQILSYEELGTVLAQIEALLNSRPLCWLSSDPCDPTALTPAHFLTLSPLRNLPAIDLAKENHNLLMRKNLLDQIVQSFWKRWHLTYLHELQTRQKWNTHDRPAQEGMVVIIQQENTPPLHWPVGIIEKVLPGSDGISRVAIVRTKRGTYKRPVVRLCPLPTQ